MNGAIHIFTLGGIPVAVSGWYLLLLLFLSSGMGDAAHSLVMAFAVTLSLLVHEFGHALVARRFRLEPRVLLHGMGGLTFHVPARDPKRGALILAAGPGAGLALGALAWGVTTFLFTPAELRQHGLFGFLLVALMWINFVWSGLNLVPLWPLDGGQLFRLGAHKILKPPRRADRLTHGLGLAIAVGGAIYGLKTGDYWIAFLAAMMGWGNYQRLVATNAGDPTRVKDGEFVRALAADAERALALGDYDEAERLGHQLRAQGGLSPRLQGRAWEIITVAAAERGEFEDALDYGAHAPPTPAVRAALDKARQALEGGG